MTHPKSLAYIQAAYTATSSNFRELLMRRKALRNDLHALDERIDVLRKALTSLADAIDAIDPDWLIGGYDTDEDEEAYFNDLAEPYDGEDFSEYADAVLEGPYGS